MTSPIGLVSGAAHAVAGDGTPKNLYAAYACRHDRIAARRSLIVIAETAGQAAQAAEFETAVAEAARAKSLSDVIAATKKTYLARKTQGLKADS